MAAEGQHQNAGHPNLVVGVIGALLLSSSLGAPLVNRQRGFANLIGSAGAGGNTQKLHIPNLQRIPGVEIVAVANRSVASAEKVCQQFSIKQVRRSTDGAPVSLRLFSFIDSLTHAQIRC